MISLLSAYLHYTSDALKFWSANPNPNPDPSPMKYEYTINKHVMDLLAGTLGSKTSVTAKNVLLT